MKSLNMFGVVVLMSMVSIRMAVAKARVALPEDLSRAAVMRPLVGEHLLGAGDGKDADTKLVVTPWMEEGGWQRAIIITTYVRDGGEWKVAEERKFPVPSGGGCAPVGPPGGIYSSVDGKHHIVLFGCFGRVDLYFKVVSIKGGRIVPLWQHMWGPTGVSVSDMGNGKFALVVTYDSHYVGIDRVPDVYVIDNGDVILANDHYPSIYVPYNERIEELKSCEHPCRITRSVAAVHALDFQGRHGEAVEFANEILEKLDGWLLESDFSQGRTDGSLESQLWQARGAVYLRQGKMEEAMREYLQAGWASWRRLAFSRMAVRDSNSLSRKEGQRIMVFPEEDTKRRKRLWQEFLKRSYTKMMHADAHGFVAQEYFHMMRIEEAEVFCNEALRLSGGKLVGGVQGLLKLIAEGKEEGWW